MPSFIERRATGLFVAPGLARRAGGERRRDSCEFAAGCSIIGTRVTVKQAVNCDILGEDVRIGLSEGSAMAGLEKECSKLEEPRLQAEKLVAALAVLGAQAKDSLGRLREFGVSGDRLFWGIAGDFAWVHGKGACGCGRGRQAVNGLRGNIAHV